MNIFIIVRECLTFSVTVSVRIPNLVIIFKNNCYKVGIQYFEETSFHSYEIHIAHTRT